MKSADPNITEIASRFVTSLRLKDIPSPISTKIKYHVLDTIGAGIAGANTSLGKQYVEVTRIEHASGHVPILGTDKFFGPAAAAFVNSGLMNALDCDDGFEINGRGMGHPGASIVAAAISGVFGSEPVSGSEFLTAVTASYEINNRLILAMQPSIERFRLVYGVCQHQSISSALAYARVSGQPIASFENILGLAGTLSNVPSLRKYNFSSRPIVSLKDFNAPAAETGVRAVQLSRAGFVGAADVLGGNTGLWRMLSSDQFDPLLFVRDLNEKWYIERNSFKAFPVCRWMHTCLEAYRTVCSLHSINVDDIQLVNVFTSSGMVSDFMERRPRTMVDAQFSLPFGIACLALGIMPFSEWFTDAALNSPQILKFADCVTATVDSEIDQLMQQERRPVARVEIITKAGRFSSEVIPFAPGSYEYPLSAAAIEEKFLSNAGSALGIERAQRLLSSLLSLENVPDMRDALKLGCRA